MNEQLLGSDKEPPSSLGMLSLPILDASVETFAPTPVPSSRRNGHTPTRRLSHSPVKTAVPGPGRLRKPPSSKDFAVGPRSAEFRRRFFPDATLEEWNDWRWQLRYRIRDLNGLRRMFRLSDDEEQAMLRIGGHLPVGITPYTPH